MAYGDEPLAARPNMDWAPFGFSKARDPMSVWPENITIRGMCARNAWSGAARVMQRCDSGRVVRGFEPHARRIDEGCGGDDGEVHRWYGAEQVLDLAPEVERRELQQRKR